MLCKSSESSASADAAHMPFPAASTSAFMQWGEGLLLTQAVEDLGISRQGVYVGI